MRKTDGAAASRVARMLILLLVAACAAEPEEETILLGEADSAREAIVYWSPAETEPSDEELELGRLDNAWRRAASVDSFNRAWEESTGVALDTMALADLPDIPDRDPAAPDTSAPGTAIADALEVRLPVRTDASGPSVRIVQSLLDRAGMSPGVIDGKWGMNTEKALYWLQRRDGLAPTGQVDSLTWNRLLELAGRPDRPVETVRLAAEDVAGPFVEIPADVYAQADLECMCYSSLSEKLGERFHSTPGLLAELNPGVDLDVLSAGDSLRVPVLGPAEASTGTVTRVVISGAGHYLHLLDAQGRILHHFPTTLGSEYTPSPSGDYSVVSVTRDPWFHYQPELLGEGAGENARIPPGPNNPVGEVWIALSKEHFGIHGTARPATIGYATSHGCVRLTNWDARFVAERVGPGVKVEFRDVGEAPVALAR